jgi:hypothetical protein
LSKPKPEVKQFGDLSSADFDTHPVWIACHTEDYAEPWFNETDEETFRPWTGALPVSPSDGILLVRARFELRDGSPHDGFLTPAFKEGDLGMLQPHLFVAGESFGFWRGLFGVGLIGKRLSMRRWEKAQRQSFQCVSRHIPVWRQV